MPRAFLQWKLAAWVSLFLVACGAAHIEFDTVDTKFLLTSASLTMGSLVASYLGPSQNFLLPDPGASRGAGRRATTKVAGEAARSL